MDGRTLDLSLHSSLLFLITICASLTQFLDIITADNHNTLDEYWKNEINRRKVRSAPRQDGSHSWFSAFLTILLHLVIVGAVQL